MYINKYLCVCMCITLTVLHIFVYSSNTYNTLLREQQWLTAKWQTDFEWWWANYLQVMMEMKWLSKTFLNLDASDWNDYQWKWRISLILIWWLANRLQACLGNRCLEFLAGIIPQLQSNRKQMNHHVCGCSFHVKVDTVVRQLVVTA